MAIRIFAVSEKFILLVHADENGYLVASENGCTNIKWIFRIWDIGTKKLYRVVIVESDGADEVAGLREYPYGNTNSHKN